MYIRVAQVFLVKFIRMKAKLLYIIMTVLYRERDTETVNNEDTFFTELDRDMIGPRSHGTQITRRPLGPTRIWKVK